MFIPKPLDRTRHGYLILDVRFSTPADPQSLPEKGALLCVRQDNELHPFVVWSFSLATGDTYSGGYYGILEDAQQDLYNRQDSF